MAAPLMAKHTDRFADTPVHLVQQACRFMIMPCSFESFEYPEPQAAQIQSR